MMRNLKWKFNFKEKMAIKNEDILKVGLKRIIPYDSMNESAREKNKREKAWNLC